MTNTELDIKIEKVENIEQLVADLRDAADEEAVKEALKAHDLDVTIEELASIKPEEEELGEEDLDNVAGGCKCRGILKRVITNLLCRLLKKLTRKDFHCPDCGD